MTTGVGGTLVYQTYNRRDQYNLHALTGFEFTKKICFSFGKVGQKFTSPDKFKLFRIILATY